MSSVGNKRHGTLQPIPSGIGAPFWRLLFLVTLFLLASQAHCDWSEPVRLKHTDAAYELGSRVDYLEDPGGNLSLEDVISPSYSFAFQQSGEETPSFGFTDSAYWFRFSLQNTDLVLENWLLEVKYPLLDKIEYFLLEDGHPVAQQISGDLLPFSKRPISQRTFLFDVEIPPGTSREVYLRVKSSSSLQLPLVLWSERGYQKADHYRQILFGLYYGTILAMLVYNLMLYASLRDPIYLYYVGYIGCFALFQASLNGLAYEYLWPEFPSWAGQATPFFMVTASLLAIQFSRSLLRLGEVMPATDRGLKGFMWLLAILSLAPFWAPYSQVVKLATAGGLITSVVLNLVGWYSWLAKVKFAAYYVLSWTAFLLGASIYALKTLAILPENFITEYAIQIGSALEVLLLSFALAYRVKLLEEENKRIQREAKLRLEHRVRERTGELKSALQELSQAHEKLERLSQLDSLTGAYNRHYFDVHYPRLWNSAQRAEEPLAVLMIDIDHFKQVNDTHGHLCGDEVLRQVATTIAGALQRNTDLLARYGGEEFVVVLPHTDSPGAMLVAERVRSMVAGLCVEWKGVQIEPHVSIGLACLMPSFSDELSTLIIRADQALYRAKSAGRDRVMAFDPVPVPGETDSNSKGRYYTLTPALD